MRNHRTAVLLAEKQARIDRAVKIIRYWWIFRRRILQMLRNPLEIGKIRVAVMMKIRRNRLKHRHEGMKLIKDFLIESLVLKDMVSKLYAYRKKAVRVSAFNSFLSRLFECECLQLDTKMGEIVYCMQKCSIVASIFVRT